MVVSIAIQVGRVCLRTGFCGPVEGLEDPASASRCAYAVDV